MLTTKDVLNQRCLLRINNAHRIGTASTRVDEYKVLEITESGNWIKLMNMDGRKFWAPTSDVALVEILKPLHPQEPRPIFQA